VFISELAKNAKALDPLKLFAEAVQENGEYIIDLNTSQLSLGLDANNKPLFPYQSADYAELKIAMGSQAPKGTPNLYLEGNFYEGFITYFDNKDLFITSTDSKRGKLKQMYGDDIFGLTEQSKKDLKTVLLPTFLTKIKDGLLRK